MLKKKDDEVFKLRQDNQTMFKDLKGLASCEETFKVELIESKGKRQELEMLMEDLKEKFQHQEIRIRNQQSEADRVKRDFLIQNE